MALRPIDNALLPLTPVRARPKKLPQISVQTLPKQPNLSSAANDENQDRLHPPTTTADPAAIDYIPSADLKPFIDPEAKIQDIVEGLESKDWVRICESLNNSRGFAIHHSTLLLPFLERIILVLVKAMKNPRSALCKTSIMASSDILSAYGDELLQLPAASDAFDQLVLQLLLKASQDKRFVCEEADKALKSMVDYTAPLLLLHKLKTCIGHSNMRVRAKAATSISNCVSKMSLEELKDYGSVSLLQMAAELLNDRLPEAREAARSIATTLYESFAKEQEGLVQEFAKEQEGLVQESWKSLCESNLAVLHAQSIVRVTVPQ
ncbi:hypothetical protein Dimus_001055 [Dionaea muscipula]